VQQTTRRRQPRTGRQGQCVYPRSGNQSLVTHDERPVLTRQKIRELTLYELQQRLIISVNRFEMVSLERELERRMMKSDHMPSHPARPDR